MISLLLPFDELKYRSRNTHAVLDINPFDEEEICIEMKYKASDSDIEFCEISDQYLIGIKDDGLICFGSIGSEIDGYDKTERDSLKIIGVDLL